jgi:hypothetical protein
MENLEYWNKLCRPPEQALRTIAAGRLKGKSDINPQWRIKAMTEAFGPVGFGWTMQITKQWIEDGSDGQRCAFANVEVKVKRGDEWSEPFHGTGGSMLVANESRGAHTSDEAFKMAVTDAISTAFKLVGVAADIYMGMFDGSKYTTPPPDQQKSKPDPKANKDYEQASKLLVDKQASLKPEQVDWCTAQIAAGNSKVVIEQLKGL